MQRRHTIVPLAAATLASAGLAQSVEVDLALVALTGTPAPMRPAGEIYQHFGLHPTGEIIFFPGPSIRASRSGEVAFSSWIGEDPAPPPITEAIVGLYAGDPADPQLLFDSSMTIPGTEASLQFDSFLGQPPLAHIHEGNASFSAKFTTPGDAPREGLWQQNGSAYILLAAHGDALPGMRPDAELARLLLPFYNGGDTYLFAEINDDLASDLDPSGFWRFRDGGSAQPIAVVDNQAPGRPDGVVFGQLTTTQRLGTVHSFDFFADDRLVFVGINKGTGIVPENDEGIWIEQTDGGFQPFLIEGGPAPSVPGIPPGGRFVSSFVADGTFTSLPAIKAAGDDVLLFHALVDTGDAPDEPKFPTVWTNRSGELELIAKGFRPVLGFVPGDPMPELDNSAFLDFSPIDINAAGDIALFAFVALDPGGDPFNSVRAIIGDFGDGRQTLAYDTGPVAGVPGAIWVDPRDSVDGLREMRQLPSGDVLVRGVYRTASGGLAMGLVKIDPSGEGVLAIQTGTGVDVFGDGSDIRTLSSFTLGEGMADAGSVTLEARFTDGSRGLFTLNFADACPADLDGDGQLTIFDFLAFQNLFDAGDPLADFDGDGDLTLFDFLEFQNQFDAGCE
ncbi:MAG: hypothetical protein NCW75_13670 [Phycisphaera sp.]|nr:MAG: hypothetical protein NCW75_13670 [Phycisphaera sp.]